MNIPYLHSVVSRPARALVCFLESYGLPRRYALAPLMVFQGFLVGRSIDVLPSVVAAIALVSLAIGMLFSAAAFLQPATFGDYVLGTDGMRRLNLIVAWTVSLLVWVVVWQPALIPSAGILEQVALSVTVFYLNPFAPTLWIAGVLDTVQEVADV